MKAIQKLKKDHLAYKITTDKSLIDMEVVHEFLSSQSYWAMGRSKEIVDRSIHNSLCFSLLIEDQFIGFGRVITDYSVFAWLADVFILPDFRLSGLGKKLIRNILNHKDLRSVKRWSLITKDAHEFYKQFGFVEISKPENSMERVNL